MVTMVTKFGADIHKAGMTENVRETSWKLLDNHRRAGQLCDVTFQCNGGEVLAHRCVLATVSDYFKVLFTSPISAASTTGMVDMDNFSVETVSLLMDVIYAEVDIPAAYVVELLKLADFVQLRWLVDFMVKNIRPNINEVNVCELYAAAKESSCMELKFWCECFVRENLQKVDMEEVKNCFDPHIFTNINVWDNDLAREVVIIRSHYSSILLLDPKYSRIEILKGEKWGGELSKLWSKELEIFTSFVHQKVVYFITVVRYSIPIGYKECNSPEEVFSIWKFQHVTKTLDLVFELKDSDLKNMLVNDPSKSDTSLSITQILYDGHENLYILCNCPMLLPYTLCVFKFDIGRLMYYKYYKGFVLAEKRQVSHLANLDNHGTCLVTPSYVLRLDQYDFLDAGFPGGDALVELSASVENYVPKNCELEWSSLDYLEWSSWHPVSKEGHFYCLINDFSSEDGMFSSLTLRLDVDRHSWILCTSRDFTCCISGGEDPYQMLFHCGCTLYQQWRPYWARQDFGHCPPPPETCCLDEKENSWKAVSFSPKTDGIDFSCYTIVPYHIFL